MGNLAAMLKEAGHVVSGSDQNLYPPMSDRLNEWGIDARHYAAENPAGADLVIVGNAISRGNPELEYVLNQRIPYTSMAAALRRFFLEGKRVIVVAGTHGKTTSTFLIDHILSVCDRPPGLFVGGLRADHMPGYRLSDSPFFVIEGDEYDTAFFDKASKFFHYRPEFLQLTSVEFDHADIFADKNHYRLAFERLLKLIPSQGRVIAALDDKGVRKVTSDYDLAPVLYYSAGKQTKKQTEAYRFIRKGRHVNFDGIGNVVDFPLIGRHNTANAHGAALLCREAGIEPEKICQALQTFPGVMRRQQIRYEDEDSVFIEDFAHHPTAVEETIHAVSDAYPGSTLHVLFEPRSASSHRKIFEKSYAEAFRKADFVYISDVYNREKVAKKERINIAAIVKNIANKKKKNAYFAENPAELFLTFKKVYSDQKGYRKKGIKKKTGKEFTASQGEKPGKKNVILAMSNGAFGGIYPEIDRFLKDRGQVR